KSEEKELFSVDEEAERISVKGTTLDLTRTEFKLLRLLASRPGRVYPRAQLVDLCAQQEGEPAFDRVIDSHIKNLRKKIARVLGDQEVIHSVYGVGYRFEIA
ncbi:MAG TPA: winged helix-turn-helix domain-containing protein, partial [Candidatus Obscuribacter sp.]|nr:winged helix-turn-helix domain-containing protein [Candidatus Obscuribacter sp.]